MEEAVAVRSFRLEEKKIVVTSQSDHQALDRHVIHLKEDIVRPDSQFNELIALENSSIRAVKKIQDELVEMSWWRCVSPIIAKKPSPPVPRALSISR